VKKVLVIAPHPDDETLGCGGTLLRHKNDGDDIHWLVCTSMPESDDYFFQREIEIEKVKDRYGFSGYYNLGLKPTFIDEYSSKFLVDKISSVVQSVKPDILYLPFAGDVHSDHKTIFEASLSCTKSFRYPYVKEVYMMETLSETEYAPDSRSRCFVPNIFVDISDFVDEKVDIMKIYTSEISDHPFPRSIKNIYALATLRGSMAGCAYAESFMLIRHIR